MTRHFINEFIRGLELLVFPNYCWVCDTIDSDECENRNGLCRSCHSSIIADPHAHCPRCAATIGSHVDASLGCPACRGRGFGFDAAVRLGPYGGRLAEGIVRTKHATGEGLAELLGRIFMERCGDELRALGCDAVVPVPLHWQRRWARGYNQAEAIARELALTLNLPLLASDLRRVKPAVQHAQSSATARRENIKGAFVVRAVASRSRKRILLVDDVMTTGSTLSEAARVLKAAGAASVVAAVLARR